MTRRVPGPGPPAARSQDAGRVAVAAGAAGDGELKASVAEELGAGQFDVATPRDQGAVAHDRPVVEHAADRVTTDLLPSPEQPLLEHEVGAGAELAVTGRVDVGGAHLPRPERDDAVTRPVESGGRRALLPEQLGRPAAGVVVVPLGGRLPGERETGDQSAHRERDHSPTARWTAA